MKVALVAYDDNDPQNNNGPVNSEIFYRCWKHMGAPKTFFEFASTTASVENCFNACSVNGSNLAGATVSIPTTHTSSCVSSLNANPPVVTVPGNHDVNCDYYLFHYQGTGGVICDAANTGSSVGMKAATTAVKVTQESIPIYA